MHDQQQLTRREVLAVGTAALGAIMTQDILAADKDLPWIDPHSHIWPGRSTSFRSLRGRRRRISIRPASPMTN